MGKKMGKEKKIFTMLNIFTMVIFLLFSLLFSLLLMTNFVQAQDYPAISIKEKNVINRVIATELDIPAEFELKIRNNQLNADNFEIYSLLDVIITPLGTFLIESSTIKTIKVTVMPRLKQVGKFGINYYIKGENAGPEQAIQDKFIIDVRNFSDIARITIPKIIDREETKLVFEISNPENIDFGRGKVIVESEFFDFEQEIDLSPGTSQKIEIDLKNLHELDAGAYTIEFKFYLEDYDEVIAERDVKLVEVIKITESDFKRIGLLSYTRNIIKKNDGNVEQHVRLELSQFILEKVFSRYDIEPDSSYYIGLMYVAVWQRELKTGETLDVKSTVDYTVPVFLLIAIILAYVGIQIAKRPRLILRKKIIKVRAKGAEFALKIVLVVKNIGSIIEDVTVVDRLPISAKIHERFGVIKPDKIEKGRLIWKFEKLMPGEEHIVSYIIYSRVIPLGKIKIPRAIAHYTDVKGKRKISYSTKLSVVHELETKKE
jgi:hypothetical protein